MGETITLHSFFDGDRSGKVRWTACELGIAVEEVRVKAGEHRSEAFRALNPWSTIPVVDAGGQVLIESTAICLLLAERHPASGLVPESDHANFWQWLFLASASLEAPTVNYYLGRAGILDARWPELVGKDLEPRLAALAARLPETGYLCDGFTLADICVAYVLKVAVSGELLAYQGRLAAYLDRLRARPAAQAARFFDSLDS